MSTKSKAQFIAWAKSRHPQAYQRATARVGKRLGALEVVASEPSAVDKIFAAITNALPSIMGTYQAKQLVDVNIERAKAGLPPIDGSGISPQVNVGVSPTVNTLLWAGLGVGALFLLTRRK